MGFASVPLPAPSPVVKYAIRMKLFGLNETKLFHFHGIFKKNKNGISKANPYTLIQMNPLFQKSWIRP